MSCGCTTCLSRDGQLIKLREEKAALLKLLADAPREEVVFVESPVKVRILTEAVIEAVLAKITPG
jgi:hypothetical protein